jgi:hypothetical protein
MTQTTRDDETKTLSVPEAGWRYFRLSRNGSYEAAKRGEIPFIKVGARKRVPVILMERKLATAGQTEGTEPQTK